MKNDSLDLSLPDTEKPLGKIVGGPENFAFAPGLAPQPMINDIVILATQVQFFH